MRRHLTLLAALAVALAPVALEAKPGRGHGGGDRAERNEGHGNTRRAGRGGGRGVRIVIASPPAQDGRAPGDGEAASVWPIAVSLRPMSRPDDFALIAGLDEADAWLRVDAASVAPVTFDVLPDPQATVASDLPTLQDQLADSPDAVVAPPAGPVPPATTIDVPSAPEMAAAAMAPAEATPAPMPEPLAAVEAAAAGDSLAADFAAAQASGATGF